ncbi:MAG: hypothetical protein Q9165_008052 [Trypethelium subeluteriae]
MGRCTRGECDIHRRVHDFFYNRDASEWEWRKFVNVTKTASETGLDGDQYTKSLQTIRLPCDNACFSADNRDQAGEELNNYRSPAARALRQRGRNTEVTPHTQNTYNSNYAPAEFINFGDNVTATIGKRERQSQTDIERNERSGYDEEADPRTPKRAKPDRTVDECSGPTNLEAKDATEKIEVRTEEESHIVRPDQESKELWFRLPSGVFAEEILKDQEMTLLLKSQIVCIDQEGIRKAFGNEIESLEALFQIPPTESVFAEFIEEVNKIEYAEDELVARSMLQDLSCDVLSSKGKWVALGECIQRWLATTLNMLADRWYHHDLGSNENKNEQWYNVTIWGRVFDDGIRAVSNKLGVNRAEMEDKATAARNNKDRTSDSMTNQLGGKKLDGIIHAVAPDAFELGAHEATLSTQAYETKLLSDGLKLRRILKDMLWVLTTKVFSYPPLTQQIGVVGILSYRRRCTVMRLIPRGCYAYLHESEHEIPTTFENISDFTRLLATVRGIGELAAATTKNINTRAHSKRSIRANQHPPDHQGRQSRENLKTEGRSQQQQEEEL